MRLLLQRVTRAAVELEDGRRREIGRGLVVLVGVGRGDEPQAAAKLAQKTARLRLFSNADGKFDFSLLDVKGQALVVSQFTLYGEAKGGRRPDFTAAAAPAQAVPLYESFAAALRELGVPVETGEFGSHMKVELVNDGPVTLWLDSERL